MPLRLGNNEPSKLYVGSQEVQRMYRGNEMVYSANSTPVTPGSVDAGLELTLTRTDLKVAPDFVGLWVTPTTQLLPQLSGLTIYDRHFHEEWYEVDWGDSGCSDYITSTGLSAWGDRNLSLHRRAGHVYETPGNYTITVRRYNAAGVLISQKSEQITINDPDVVFDANHTCVVSKVSNWTGAPAHNVTRSEITSALDWASSQDAPVRISVHTGEEFTMDNRLIKDRSNLYITTYGTGPKPIMKAATSFPTGILRVYEQNNVGSVIAGFNLQGNWDSTKENVIPGTTDFGNGIRAYGNGFLIVHNCDASGFSTAFGSIGDTALTKVVVSQSTVTNWQDYGIYIGSAPGNQAWLLGVRMNQHVDALSGGRGKVKGVNYAGNDHSALRAQCEHIVIECVEGFTRNAWHADDRADDASSFRLHMNGPARTICGNRILCEGGLAFYADGAAANSRKSGMNIRMTNMIHFGNYPSKVGVEFSNGGTTLENLLLIRSDNQVATGTQTNRNAIGLGGASSEADNLNENNISPVRVRNATVVNLTSDANAGGRLFGPVSTRNQFQNAEVYDLVEYTIRTNSAHDDGPFNLVPLREPLYKGQRFGTEFVVTTMPKTVQNGESFTMPYPAGTSQANYFADGWTVVQTSGGGGNHTTENGNLAVNYGLNEITFTNRSGATWTVGNSLKLKLDRRLSPPPFTHATPAGSYHLYHPTPGNTKIVGQATGGADGITPRRDLLLRVRPASPSKGALEPVSF